MTVERPKYPHLNLHRWPFTIVPTAETAEVWVGRPEVRQRARLLVASSERVDAASLILLWASFGAGKTHLLRHIDALARQRSAVAPLYVAVPQGVRSFLEIYRAIIDAAAREGLVDAAASLTPPDSDVGRALAVLAGGTSDQRQVAHSWIRGDRVPARALRDVGVSHRIDTTADAVDALADVIEILRGRGRRVMLLIDEVQELAEMRRNVADAVGGLRKLFDRSPELTLVLSFTTGAQAAVRAILGDALLDRASDLITLPALDESAAVEFVVGLVAEWSVDEARSPFPFTREAMAAVVAEMSARGIELTPRNLVKQFDRILRDADLDVDDGLQKVDAAYAVAHMGNSIE